MDTAIESVAPVQTVTAVLAEATASLATAGVSTPRLDAEVLLAAAWGVERSGLYARWSDRVPRRCLDRFRSMLERRVRREPLQYIIGRQEFWSLDFAVTPDVLIPRPETELLVELTLGIALREPGSNPSRSPLPLGTVDFLEERPSTGSGRAEKPDGIKATTAQAEPFDVAQDMLVEAGFASLSTVPEGEGARGKKLAICDVGTGSGCIAVALAHEQPRAEVWALDISPAALAVAASNARCCAVADRIHCIESDLFRAVTGMRFDAIVSNPPYVSSSELESPQPELLWEPRGALDGGATGCDVVERLLPAAYEHLAVGGWLVMEIGAEQGPTVEALARAATFRDVSVRCDYAGLPRVLLARR